MPIRYQIDEEISAVVARAEGVLTEEDILDYARNLLEDPEVKQARHELVDLSRVDPSSNISSKTIRRISDFWKSQYGTISGGRLALVAPEDLAFGLSRMYQLLRDDGPDDIQVFRDGAASRAWLLES